MSTGVLELTLEHPGRIVGADKAVATIVVNGEAVEEMKVGETASVDASTGSVELSLFVAMGPMIRKSKAIEVTVREGETTRVSAKYSKLWGKYKLALA